MEEPPLPVGWQVHIIPINTLVSVVVHVIAFEGNGHRDSYWKVGPDAKETICKGILVSKGHVMADVMNGQS